MYIPLDPILLDLHILLKLSKLGRQLCLFPRKDFFIRPLRYFSKLLISSQTKLAEQGETYLLECFTLHCG